MIHSSGIHLNVSIRFPVVMADQIGTSAAHSTRGLFVMAWIASVTIADKRSCTPADDITFSNHTRQR